MTRRLVLGVLAVLMMALTACDSSAIIVSIAEPVAAPTVVSDTKPTAEPTAGPTAESASDAGDTTPAEPVAEPSGGERASPTATTLDMNYADAAPPFAQLVVGTMLLEGTPYRVTTEQAQELLFLWQVYRAICICRGDTAPSREEALKAINDRIMAAMTPEQLGAIQEMQLTQGDVVTFIQENYIPRRLGRTEFDNLTAGFIKRLEMWAR